MCDTDSRTCTHDPVNEYFFYDDVSPAQMDTLWAGGWRHFGGYFFRYASTQQEGRTFAVLPLRMRLSAFAASRSQTRTLKRNADLEVRVVPAYVDAEVEDLFEHHKTRFSHNVPESIYSFVSHEPDEVPCRCVSLCLFKDDRLVGISYLDIGKTASSSVYQCFDPLETKRSLGNLMILLSVQHSHSLGKTLYYPGYAYKEPSHYDYKKNFVGLEAYDWKTATWPPLPRSGGQG